MSRYELVYRCWDQFGLIGEFQPDDVFIINGLQWEWTKHLDAVKLARSAVGLALAAAGVALASGLRDTPRLGFRR